MEKFGSSKYRISEITNRLFALRLRSKELEDKGENVISDAEYDELLDLRNEEIKLVRERDRLS